MSNLKSGAKVLDFKFLSSTEPGILFPNTFNQTVVQFCQVCSISKVGIYTDAAGEKIKYRGDLSAQSYCGVGCARLVALLNAALKVTNSLVWNNR